jgi:FHS family L-fucose permease-like MFS transporter
MSALPPARESWSKLSALSAVYLVWGAIASLNDLLIPYLKSEFGLDFSGAMRIQLVFYTAYFILSIPCGMLARRFGYRNGILTGLAIAVGGCMLMMLASQAASFGVVLTAIFVLASGITMLQVSANPYATSLGPEPSAPSRLTLVQSFHSLGTTIGPWLGAVLIFSATATAFDISGSTPGNAIWRPYFVLALVLISLAFIFLRVDADRPAPGAGPFSVRSALRANRRLLPGTLGIFCYVGAEIAIASFLVNYFVRTDILGLEYGAAGKLVSVYWGFALAGRFAGAALLRRFSPRRMLLLYAIVAATLVATSVTASGWLSAGAILLVGFFNSIMFPTIFALTIRDSSREEKPAASGILCLGIVGGAVVSQMQGYLADAAGLQMSFLLPVGCYLYIAYLSAIILKPGLNFRESP